MPQTLHSSADSPSVMILGIGNTLFSDEGFGVRALEALDARYRFAANVTLVDGGVLGVNLLGYICQADHLVVIDCIRNQGAPGTLYRFFGEEIPERIRAKNSLHQVDFLEALTLCQAMDKVPETVIVGVEPADIETLDTRLTAVTRERIPRVMDMVLREMDRLGVSYCLRGDGACVPGDCMRFDG